MYTKYKFVHFCPYLFVHTILSIPFCPYHFAQYHFVRIPFCPYHFVRTILSATILSSYLLKWYPLKLLLKYINSVKFQNFIFMFSTIARLVRPPPPAQG